MNTKRSWWNWLKYFVYMRLFGKFNGSFKRHFYRHLWQKTIRKLIARVTVATERDLQPKKSSLDLRCLGVLLWLDSHLSMLLISFNSWLFTSQHLHGHATYDVHPIDNDSSACTMIFSVYNVYLHVAFNAVYYYTRVIVVKLYNNSIFNVRTHRETLVTLIGVNELILRSSCNSNFIICSPICWKYHQLYEFGFISLTWPLIWKM